MKRKSVIVLSIFLIFSLFTYILSAQPMTLPECIQYAERNNPTLQSANLDVNVAEIRLKQTRLQMAPVVTANAGQNFGYSHGSEQFSINGNYSVNAGVEIFNGLNTYNSIKQSEIQLTQAQLQEEQQKNQVRIQIIRSYLTILMNQEMLEYQRNVLASSRQQVAEGEQKYKVGQILESDYMMLQAQYLADSTSMENTLIAINNEYVSLRNYMNMSRAQALSVVLPDSAQLAASMVVPELDEVLRRTFDYLPDVKMSRNAVEIAEYDVKIAKSAYYPSLSASAGVGTGYNAAYGNGNSGLVSGLYKGLSESIGLSLSIPIYKQSSVRNNVKVKNIQVQQAELALKTTEEQITKEIEIYYLDLKKAYNNFQLSELQKSAYYANYMAYNQRFQYGAITTVDLLQQQTNYLNILNNYMQNKYNYLMQLKVLDVYTGQPVTL
ncbi:MAG: TolC family protein [Bacteroidales bacterium]|nr:TolC family protein [Bacteroidales bacterium]